MILRELTGLVVVLFVAFGGGCTRQPPPSRFPTARAAIDRMRETASCSRGVRGEAKVDYFGEDGRVRGNTLFVASRPEKLRFDVYSPFGLTLSTLTSDGRDFAFLDIRNKKFFFGPANACNVRRFLQVPVPPHALVELLSGVAPILVHEPAQASIDWEGEYVIRIQSKHGASQQIRLEPVPEDWSLPYAEQRLRVLEVAVEQKGVELYHVELADHEPAPTAEPRVDPDGIEPDLLPSGPKCEAGLPRRLKIVSPVSDQDVLFIYQEIVHNPPVYAGLYRQSPPRGVTVQQSPCAGR